MKTVETDMKNKVVSVIMVVASVTLLSVLAFYVRVGVTADSVAVLQTTGMTCGSCSDKISKSLESLKGVAVTEVDLNGGLVIVSYDTKNIKPENLAEKVSGAGYKSSVYAVLTPEQFRQAAGRNVGEKGGQSGGCCGGKGGGCGMRAPAAKI
jgi:periplasmic mercuric ion binding protein